MPTHPTATALQRLSSACPVPPLPRRLGAGGVIPFLLLPLLGWADPFRQTAYLAATVAYGAVILSFVGALHWAFAMTVRDITERQRGRLYLWSVVPSLLGWAAMLLPLVPAFGLLLGGLWLQFRRDRDAVVWLPLPDWYLSLRLALTSGASAGLAAGLWIAWSGA